MLVSIFIKLLSGFLALLIVMRLLGKKSLTKVTPFDLIYTMLLGGILEEAVYEEHIEVTHVLFALAVFGILIYIFEVLVHKNRFINHLIKGEPSVVIKKGVLNGPALKKNKIEMEQLRSMLREQNCFSVENAENVIIENGGHISLSVKDEEDKVLSFCIVDEGRMSDKVIESLSLNKHKILTDLKELGHELKDLKYAEWSPEKGYYCVSNSDLDLIEYRIDG